MGGDRMDRPRREIPEEVLESINWTIGQYRRQFGDAAAWDYARRLESQLAALLEGEGAEKTLFEWLKKWRDVETTNRGEDNS